MPSSCADWHPGQVADGTVALLVLDIPLTQGAGVHVWVILGAVALGDAGAVCGVHVKVTEGDELKILHGGPLIEGGKLTAGPLSAHAPCHRNALGLPVAGNKLLDLS